MNKEVLLFTSGVDSYIARDYLIDTGHNFDCLYFNHGGRYCEHELEMIDSLDFDVIISNNLDLGLIEEENAHIPNRNLLMTIMAQSLGYEKIWLGGSLSDRVGDNQSEVFIELSRVLSDVNDIHCKIDSPFYHCYKDDMVRWWVSRHQASRIDLVKNTFSCFNPLDEEVERSMWIQGCQGKYFTRECMGCSACFRKCAVLYSGDIFLKFIENTPYYILQGYEEQFSKPLVATARSVGTIAYINKWWEMRDAEEAEVGL